MPLLDLTLSLELWVQLKVPVPPSNTMILTLTKTYSNCEEQLFISIWCQGRSWYSLSQEGLTKTSLPSLCRRRISSKSHTNEPNVLALGAILGGKRSMGKKDHERFLSMPPYSLCFSSLFMLLPQNGGKRWRVWLILRNNFFELDANCILQVESYISDPHLNPVHNPFGILSLCKLIWTISALQFIHSKYFNSCPALNKPCAL